MGRGGCGQGDWVEEGFVGGCGERSGLWGKP